MKKIFLGTPKFISTFLLRVIFSCFFMNSLHAQMWNGQDTLYGNEWINYENADRYYKMVVNEDGIYRFSFEILQQYIPSLEDISGDQFQLFHFGEEIPIYVSTNGNFGAGDYIEFYGKRNRAELDRFLFQNPDGELFNPEYSMFSDESAYFLTWQDTGGGVVRYNVIGNDLSNTSNLVSYFVHSEKRYFQTTNVKKTVPAGNVRVSESRFVEGQGFGSNFGKNHNQLFNTSSIAENGSGAELSVWYAGNTRDHVVEISINDQTLATDNFSDFGFKKHIFQLETAQITAETSIKVTGTFDANDKNSIAFIELKYPKNFDFDGQDYVEFSLPASPVSQYLEIQNFAASTNPVLYDLTNNTRLIPTIEGDLVKIGLPAFPSERKFVLINEELAIKEISNIEQTVFTDFSESAASFIIITHPIFFDDGQGNNWVQKYAEHRNSEAGGDYETAIVNIEELYDQYAYGIKGHSISVRNFGHFIQKEWDNPQYVFLIGKGLQYPTIRLQEDFETFYLSRFFLPTFGNPGSDNLLLSTNETSKPIFPIGRLAATSAADIKIYYEKIIGFEAQMNLPATLEGKGWMKRIAHFGGGGVVSEQTQIKNHLNNFKTIVEGNDFAGDVYSFFKTSADPIQNSQSGDILKLINTGVSMMTFFGHSSANGFDFSLDSPESYGNEDRYPLMMSFGCYSGRCHDDNLSIGEEFVLAEKSGASAYMATTGFGFVSSLGTFGNNFYGLLGGDYYGKGVGDILQKVIENLEDNGFIGDFTLAQQITLQGDPSLRINAHPGPDYIADIGTVSNDPQLVNIALDEFQLDFSIHNIGQGIKDSFWLQIDQKLPNGQITELRRERVRVPEFKADFSYTLPLINQDIIGLNYFNISVDTENEIAESPVPAAENNNILISSNGEEGYPILIVSNDLVPIYPPNFGIVNGGEVILKASTANPFTQKFNYIFEIDSTELFNSPIHQSTEINSIGGVLKWTPNMNYESEKVYYWRVSQDSTEGNGYRWFGHSFLYDETLSEGWNQSHYYQYLNNDFSNTEVFDFNRKLKFVDDVKDIEIQNNARDGWDFRPWFYLNNDALNWWSPPISAGVYIAVLDGASGLPWEDSGGSDYGEDGFNGKSFSFKTNTTENRQEVIEFLDNTVPDGDYVILMSHQRLDTSYEPEEWALDSAENTINRNIFQVLEEQGAAQVRMLEETGSVPYVFSYKKNDALFEPVEFLSDTITGIFTHFDIVGVWDEGFVTSDDIGPAANWESFSWELEEIELDFDVISMQVWGIDKTGKDTLILSGITENVTDLTMIDAAVYPYLKLRYNVQDEENRTPPQYKFWRIIYEELPEAALNPNLSFMMNKDSLEQGEHLELEVAIENIGKYDMDSLLVRFQIFDTNNQEIRIERRVQPLLKAGNLTVGLDLDTRELTGMQTLLIDVNPANDQPELTHINNIGNLNFTVINDLRNPLLDVTFDGTHIMNGDLVSPEPNIVISLQDENEYLGLSDTSLFNVFIQYPEIEDPVLIPFDSEIMIFIPANGNNLEDGNKATVELRPQFLQDGLYYLIVQARDVAGNQSGELDYKIGFEIITKSSISNFLNYPNPFSNSTRFVYTMTGSETPTFFKIQIMTVSGRVVREITQNEMGPLQTGTHTTEFAWDGTDEFGDKLGNGIYLYRIIAKNTNGEPIDLFESDADQYFKKGFGKMVLIR